MMRTTTSMFLFASPLAIFQPNSRFLDAAHEEEGAVRRVADEKQERLVGGERLSAGGRCPPHCYGGRGGGFGAFLVHVHEGLVRDMRDAARRLACHPGEVGN